MGAILISCVYHNQSPKTGYLKRTEICSFAVLEAEVRNQGADGAAPSVGSEGDLSGLAPCLWWPLAVLSVPCLTDASPQPLPLSAHHVLLCVSSPLLFSYYDACHWIQGAL